MKRYDANNPPVDGWPPQMQEAPDGDYVRFEDAAALVKYLVIKMRDARFLVSQGYDASPMQVLADAIQYAREEIK